MIGFGIGFSSRARRPRTDVAFISSLISPMTSPLTVGQSLADTQNWLSILELGNYTSSSAKIDVVTINFTGSTPDALTAFQDGDINQFGVTVTDTGGLSRTFSAPARTVVYATPSNTRRPLLLGNTGLGDTLRVTTGTWANAVGGQFTYQWLRNDVAISAAMSSSYTIVLADGMADLRCCVSYTNSGGTALAISNVITIDSFAPPAILGVPAISGILEVGETLSATPAVATNGSTQTWQWFASGTVIDGATSDVYVLTSAEDGDSLTVRQTQTNAFGSDAAASAATGFVTYTAPTAAAGLLDQSFANDTGLQSYDVHDDFTGDALTFSVTGPAGVSIEENTGLVRFDTGMLGVQTGTPLFITVGNSGGTAQSTFSLDITEDTFVFINNADGSFAVTTEGLVPEPNITNNMDGTVTVGQSGVYIYKPVANAEDDFTGAVGSDTLTTTTGANTFKVYKRIATGVVVTQAVTLPQPSAANIVLLKNDWSDLTKTDATDESDNAQSIVNYDSTKVTVNADGFSSGIDSVDLTSGGWFEFDDPKVDLTSSARFCFEMWVKHPSTGGSLPFPSSNRLLSGRSTTGFGQFSWVVDDDGTSRLIFWNGSSNNTILDSTNGASGVMTANTWHHWCIERIGDDSDFHIYLDGVLQDSALASFPSNTDISSEPTTIGSSANNRSRRWSGEIGPMRLVVGEGLYGGDDFTPATQFEGLDNA